MRVPKSDPIQLFCLSLALGVFCIPLEANAQAANPPSLAFLSIPTGATSGQLTTKIGATSAEYKLEVVGPNIDQFTVSTQTPACSDSDLKNAKCQISVASGSTPVVNLAVTFTPSTSAPASAWVYAVNDKNVATRLLAITGNSACAPYSDCDLNGGLGATLLGGIEQSYQSSSENQTNGFIRAFLNVRVPLWEKRTGSVWAVIRDLGAPEANSNQNLVSAISNPDGTITSSALSTIGYSVDFLSGVGYQRPFLSTNGQYSIGPIAAFGATTPLSSASATVGYVVPPLGTEECTQLQARFAAGGTYAKGYSTDLVAGTAGSTTPANANCLLNVAGGITTPVTTLAFAGINRSSFLEKWEVGGRTIYRSHTTSTQTDCTQSDPCQRGIVDFTIGQDAAVTRGQMRNFVFKLDGVQPFPYSNGYFYIFGTLALRLEKNTDLPPLVLGAASSAALQSIPIPNVFVEPFVQPNKDFYRIGIGISIDKIFTQLSTKTTPAPTPPVNP